MPANPFFPLTVPDLVCDLDVDSYGAETTSDLQTLIQDVFHVLKELPGTNPDDPDRGCGAELILSAPQDALIPWCKNVEEQLRRDDRVTDVSVTLTSDNPPNVMVTIEVDGQVIPLTFGFLQGNFSNLTLIPNAS